MIHKFYSLRQRIPKLTATWRLTLSYLAVLMIVSLILTVPLYRVSAQIGERGLRNERLYFEGVNPNGFDPGYQQIETGQISGLHARLRDNLIGLNVIILLGGGALSYYLARRTLKPIEAALAAQTRFAGDASHELRTPLTAMKSEIEVALRDPKLSASEAREMLASNLEEVIKLEGLATGLLHLARQDNETLERVPVAAAVIIEQAIERVAKSAVARKISFDTAAKGGVVIGDVARLVELLVVLLDNAAKYSPEGGTVTVSTKLHGGTVDIVVRDTGIGIAPADMEHIFERFYRADSSRSKTTPGYGLGLPIAAQIAELHGGSIDASSRIGHGATFTVHLPAADA